MSKNCTVIYKKNNLVVLFRFLLTITLFLFAFFLVHYLLLLVIDKRVRLPLRLALDCAMRIPLLKLELERVRLLPPRLK